MEHTSGREKVITSIDCLEAWCRMSESLCIAETSPLPEAGADVVTTDGDGALAHSCRDAARWGRGEGVQAWNTIPLPSPLPEWVTGGW